MNNSLDLVTRLRNFTGKLGKKELFIVFLIFLFALAIRGHLMRYELFFEFDTYYHARLTGYVLQQGYVPDLDPLGYYWKAEGQPIPKTGFLFWYFGAFLYKLFTLNAPYNKNLLIFFVKFLPAFYGALISAAMYYLGKHAYNKQVGLVMAFFAATVPAFVYRTMAGQYEDDALGFLWMVIGFTFLIKSIKSPEETKLNYAYVLAASAFFILMATTWEMATLIPLILVGHLFWTTILMWFKGADKKQIITFSKFILIALILFCTVGYYLSGTNWAYRAFSYFSAYVPVSAENIQRIEAPPTEGNVLSATIGEENTGRQFFGTKYNALIILPILALFIIPFRLFKGKLDTVSIIFFVWILTTFYMAWGKLKFTYTFGLPVAMGAGIVCLHLFEYLKNRNHIEKSLISIPFALLLLVAVASGIYFVTQNIPSIESQPAWKDATSWMYNNIEKDANLFNWWDEGHWISFLAERKVLLDNRNAAASTDYEFARFVLAVDNNETGKFTSAEDIAFGYIKQYNANYVILSGDLMSKHQAMGLYAYETIHRDDPRITKYFSIAMPCNLAPRPGSNEIVYSCGGNTLSQAQMSMLPTTWITSPNQLQEGRIPIFVYRSADNRAIYALNNEVNNTFLTRLWFNDSTIKHFKEVYNNGEVRVYKIV